MLKRPRRNRKSGVIRDLVQENHVSVNDLIYPLFLLEPEKGIIEVESMPGIFRMGIEPMLREIEQCAELGIRTFDIFPVVDEHHKDKTASKSQDPDFFYLKAIRRIKTEFPNITLMSDVAMDPYSSDGHDGLVDDHGRILNDESLEILAAMALAQADSGVDIIGPSDMMDGRVGHLRRALDREGYDDVSIMSYTAKYASAYYGPFRDALDSAPKHGDKKTYQMNPANQREALIEARLDVEEGADFLMVKPALPYLDIIRLLRDNFELPVAAYHVSGEYAMVTAAAQRGWLDREAVMYEQLMSIKRAGADIILTYFAKEFASLVNR